MDTDWQDLPKHLLHSVLKALESSIDYLQFSNVCTSWNDLTKDNQSKQIKNLSNVPLLLVPAKRRRSRTWSLYSILDNKFLETKLLLPRCIYSGKRFGGSSEGWLATLHGDLTLTLYKPFMDVKKGKDFTIIHLPPLLEENLSKVVTFTYDPGKNPNDLICVVIIGGFGDLSYISPAKDTTWTRVSNLVYDYDYFEDVVYYNAQFYALTCRGKLASFDVADSNIKFVEMHSEEDVCLKKYLVESNGLLLQVQRFTTEDSCDFNPVTKEFKVFKLSFDGPMRWIEINNLGDVALFLGDNSSFSVVASNFSGCQGNCIYFTQDKHTLPLGVCGPWDLGVYNLKSGRLTRGFSMDAATIAKMRGGLPIWVVPSLNI